MAKNLCAAVVKEVVQVPGLPQYRISRLQLVPVLPQKQRVELWPAATRPELAPELPGVAAGSNPRMVLRIFPEAALESFPAWALLFLFWLFSPWQLSCLLRLLFSFAIFSSHVLASGSGIFSISLEQLLIQASRPVLSSASLPLPYRTLLPASFCYDPAILPILSMPRSPFPAFPTPLLLTSLLVSDSAIFGESGTGSVSSSICFCPSWLWQRVSVTSSESGRKKVWPPGSFRIRRSAVLRYC